MDIRLPRKLKILSYYLPSLYIVGGYVRNSLLELPVSDVDLAAEYTVQELATALSNTEFFLKDFNKKLGTVKILSREDRRFQAEYTTFRIDSYPVNSGAHTPSDVIFTRDIEKDTLRRDFTVNAIYYSIDTAEYVDYTGGIPDLYKHVLRTTQSPEKVFSEDGLRILRMVRIAAELGFDIDEETLDGAKKSVHLLKDISGERKREEFLKILRADRKYPSDRTKDSEVKALRVLDEIGALEYILPGISAAKGMEQRPDFHVYDVFNHLIETVRYCPPDLRLAGLLHDVGKPLSVQKYGNMHMHAKTGQEIAKKILGRDGLKMSNRDLNKILRLIDTHMYDIDGLTSEKKIRMFVVDNLEIINDIIALKRADAKASQGDASATSVSAEKINKVYREMLTDGTPLAYSDLKVDGNDLVGTKIPEDKRAWAMRKILEHAVLHEDCRTRESQLQYLRGLNYGSTSYSRTRSGRRRRRTSYCGACAYGSWRKEKERLVRRNRAGDRRRHQGRNRTRRTNHPGKRAERDGASKHVHSKRAERKPNRHSRHRTKGRRAHRKVADERLRRLCDTHDGTQKFAERT